MDNMKLEDIKENLRLIDEIDGEIKFLEEITGLGIYSVSIKPNFSHERTMTKEMMANWVRKEMVSVMEQRMRDLNNRKRFLLREIGVE